MDDFSEYIVYVDESGDHSMSTINPSYPMFVLAFCIFRKDQYITKVIPDTQSLKFKYWGHDMIVLHEKEIRKPRDEYSILQIPEIRGAFFSDINRLIRKAPFTIIACAIQKGRLADLPDPPSNPYHIALEAGLCKLFEFLKQQGQENRTTHIVLEKRGKREDNELELEFRRICDGENSMRKLLPFRVLFAGKQANSCGLQLADMVARPIGIHCLRPSPDKPNRAFDLLKPKFYGYSELAKKNPDGLIEYE